MPIFGSQGVRKPDRFRSRLPILDKKLPGFLKLIPERFCHLAGQHGFSVLGPFAVTNDDLPWQSPDL